MLTTQFQTIVDIPEYAWKTGYAKQNMFIGSCFTENVGMHMETLKYQVDINPFGILYNPMSVATCLEILLHEKEFSEKDLYQHNGLWHSFNHHGRFSSNDKNTCLNNINSRIKSSSAFLKQTNFLFITFGTAWIYRRKVNNEVVSNCHKIPAKEFMRERLSVNSIVEKYTILLNKLWQVNPNVKVVFTVSPIRHWKDGAIENQRSKSTLLLAVDALQRQFENQQCAYFPSYEIMMDELRDYRFYADDMLHPTNLAVQHIWQIFEQALINKESVTISSKIRKIINAVRHRPINKNSMEFYNFLTSFQKKIDELEQKHPFLNLRLEKEYFNVQIKAYNKLSREL